jgi:hypothetical protein
LRRAIARLYVLFEGDRQPILLLPSAFVGLYKTGKTNNKKLV